MQNKSNIQLINESIREKETMLKVFSDFINKYDIQDAIFTYNKGKIYEVSEGYFEVIKESQNIKDIISEYTDKYCIRINGENIQLGLHHKYLSEALNVGKIYEIKSI